MPRFTIVPTDQNFSSAEIVAADASSTIYAVGRLQCGQADVFEDDAYKFSLRVDANGPWCIFQRGHDPEPVSAFG